MWKDTVLDCVLRIEQVVLYRVEVGHVKKGNDTLCNTGFKPDGKVHECQVTTCVYLLNSQKKWTEKRDKMTLSLLPSHDLDLYSNHGPLSLTLKIDTCNILFPSLFPNI